MTVQRRILDGCEIATVMVEPCQDPPVRYQGRVWVKVGPTLRLATPEEERRLTERRRARDLPFDMRPAHGATLGDLDLDHLRTQYLPRAVSADVLEANQRPLEDQLRSLVSPGGLYGQVTPENFGRGATDYRNPLVAEVMHHLGFCPAFRRRHTTGSQSSQRER